MEDTQWFNGLTTEDAREERSILRKVIAALGAVCALVLFLIAVTWPTGADALPIMQANAEGTTITLTDEDCKLPAVSNLPKRAVWVEKGKSYEGCWGGHPMFPLVISYFSDKTIVVLPVEMFTPVRGA